ncbi:hypothetical protein [Salibaculum griseiflavum]|uniref:hypothetical protein n=1 Tax=Salibaculum griseiflavum TaxID=1914409 RepID=UPI0011B1E459|nr:hypothetical protein [Salibaculum griseiflavum]
MSSFSFIYILIFVNTFPRDLAFDFVKVFSLAQIISAFVTFGGRQRLLFYYSGKMDSIKQFSNAVSELCSYSILLIGTILIALIIQVIYLGNNVVNLAIMLGGTLGLGDLIFHKHLATRNISIFSINFGIIVRLFHVLLCALLIYGAKLELALSHVVFFLCVGFWIVIGLELFKTSTSFKRCRGSIKISIVRESVMYWVNSLTSVSFVNIPQYKLADVGTVSDLNFYRILLLGPLVSSIIIQAILPWFSRLEQIERNEKQRRNEVIILIQRWAGSALFTFMVVMAALFLGHLFSFIDSSISFLWILVLAISFCVSGSGAVIVATKGNTSQPISLIFGLILIKMCAIFLVLWSSDPFPILFVAHSLMIILTLFSVVLAPKRKEW